MTLRVDNGITEYRRRIKTLQLVCRSLSIGIMVFTFLAIWLFWNR